MPEIDIDKLHLQSGEIQLVFDINPSQWMTEVINENLENVARSKGIAVADVEWQIVISSLSFIRHQSDFNPQPCLHPLSDYQIYQINEYNQIDHGFNQLVKEKRKSLVSQITIYLILSIAMFTLVLTFNIKEKKNMFNITVLQESNVRLENIIIALSKHLANNNI